MITEGIDSRFWTRLCSLWVRTDGPLFRKAEKHCNPHAVVKVFDERFALPRLLFVALDDKC